jgi:N-carbamoylputrescine amidase
MRVAVIQQHNGADLEHNLERTMAMVRDAAHQGATLVLLQELHRSLYFCQSEDTAVFDLAGLYRKMHIPDDPGFYEKFYFTPGDATRNDGQSGFTPIRTSAGTLGLLVCWDQWYPEAARLMALAGAELLLYPTAIGWERGDDAAEQQRQLDAWLTVQRAHAIANGLPVLVANRTGFEPGPAEDDGIDFWGSSFICGPQGEFLARAGEDDEAILVTDLDMARSESVRRIWPYLRDRRVDAYADLSKRYRD